MQQMKKQLVICYREFHLPGQPFHGNPANSGGNKKRRTLPKISLSSFAIFT
jgi:hypothetical protein